MPEPYQPPIASPWILPPDKAPKMWTSALILLTGFLLLIGGLFYNFYALLHGAGFDFLTFMGVLLLAIVIIMVGAVRLAKAYASKRYAELMRQYRGKR